MLILAFSFLALGLWRLQLVQGQAHGRAAERNAIRLNTIPAPRGVVYDRGGQILAENAPVFVVSLVEADLPENRRVEVLDRLARLLGTTRTALERTLDQRRVPGDVFFPVRLRSHLERSLALTLEQEGWELPGVRVSVESARQYPEGDLLSHVLGYLTQPSPGEFEQKYRGEGYSISSLVGASGVEATYESALRGSDGARLSEVDAGGRPLGELGVVPPIPGGNVKLTIDLNLQRSATNILRAKLQPGSSGAAILADPRTGEILALVSLPTFDANVFSRPDSEGDILTLLQDPSLPLFHRAIAGQYPPGSTFKLAVGIGALQEGVASRNTQIRSEGGLRVPNPYNPRLFTWFPDWAVLGDMNFIRGLALSSNVYFATLAGGFGDFQGLGVDRVAQYARLVGYGAATGIDLPSEEAGRVPTPTWKVENFGEGWLTGDTYNMAVGQGFVLATPLQVANVTNAIANNGTMMRPHVAQAVLDQGGRTIEAVPREVIRQLGVRSDVIQVIREGMISTLEQDRVRAFQIPGVKVAGKTGTAEYVGPRDAAGNLPTHGWFTGFAPAEDPQVTVTVFLEKGGGPTDAVPIAMDMLRAYLERKGGAG
ncbi:MAG: penicillin-binding protein 2 [Chloroflexi bacterium]|nr:penicillin-binding protein 2 [Chloroflexota bacterium]